MSDLARVTQVLVPLVVMQEGHEILRAAGRAGLEGMILWAGTQVGEQFRVTELIVPRQRGLRTADGLCVVVDGDELHRLNVYLFESNLQLIAQIHSHPGMAYHSSTDDEFAVATTAGCFSLVVPDFAVREFNLEDTAVYRLSESGKWLEVDESRSPNHLVIQSA